MKGRKRAIRIAVVVCVLSITVLLILNISSNPKVEGWNDFKKATINNYSFIQDVNIDRITPVDIYISFRLRQKIDIEEVNEVFLMTENYIFSEKVFKDLQEYHADKYKYGFSRIKVYFTYWSNNDKSEWKIYSSQDVSDEPDYNSFSTWYIEYNNEPTQIYNPILK